MRNGGRFEARGISDLPGTGPGGRGKDDTSFPEQSFVELLPLGFFHRREGSSFLT